MRRAGTARIVCLPGGRFTVPLPASADLSGISKLLAARKGGRPRGACAYPETQHVTSGSTRLQDCFLSMLSYANNMERDEEGRGLAYITGLIAPIQIAIEAAERAGAFVPYVAYSNAVQDFSSIPVFP
jgi:hypothetical protein